MKMRYLVGIALSWIANTWSPGGAWAGPGPAESTVPLYSLDNSGYVIYVGGSAHDNRLYTGDGDWRRGFSKVECGPGHPAMAGISSSGLGGVGLDSGDSIFEFEYHWTTQTALCASSDTLYVDWPAGVSVWFGDSDARRDTSTGDWARGLVKAECGNDEIMTGFAQQQEGINEFRCSPANTIFVDEPVEATSCAVVDFDGHEGYDPGVPGAHRADWSYGYSKGSCGSNRYLKGFAVDSQNGTTNPVKILCCGAQTYGDGTGCNADEQCYGGTCQFYRGASYGVCRTPIVK